eukprot:1583279-Amphidinium_carterae.1
MGCSKDRGSGRPASRQAKTLLAMSRSSGTKGDLHLLFEWPPGWVVRADENNGYNRGKLFDIPETRMLAGILLQ